MGLDMHLTAKAGDENVAKEHKEKYNLPDNTTVYQPIFHVGYWRKANHIHNWFVANAQDGVDECQETYIDDSQLRTLRGVCLEVLADKTKAPTLLPTKPGFFFGGTDYDERYFQDIEATLIIVEKALNLKMCDVHYQSSW